MIVEIVADFGPEHNNETGFIYKEAKFLFADATNRDEFLSTSTKEDLDAILERTDEEEQAIDDPTDAL